MVDTMMAQRQMHNYMLICVGSWLYGAIPAKHINQNEPVRAQYEPTGLARNLFFFEWTLFQIYIRMTSPLVICIAGIARAGKDTTADMIIELCAERGLTAVKVGLADCLKKICQDLVKACYGIDVPIAHFYDEEKKMVAIDGPMFMGRPLILRNMLQHIGTEILRDNLGADVWCDALYRLFVKPQAYQVVVISDCRFPNEVAYFRRAGPCVVIRIQRQHSGLSGNPGTHASEVGVRNIVADHEIMNDGELDDLKASVTAQVSSYLPTHLPMAVDTRDISHC